MWSVVICTEPFETLAKLNARARKVEDLDVIVLPHPLGVRPVGEVQQFGREVAERMAALGDARDRSLTQ